MVALSVFMWEAVTSPRRLVALLAFWVITFFALFFVWRMARLIALWLGHDSPSTTHMYVEADLGMKERALARLDPPELKSVRFRPSDALLRFLQGL